MRGRRLRPMMNPLPMLPRRLRPLSLPPALALLTLGALSGSANAASPSMFAEAAEARLHGGGPLLRNDCSGLIMTVLHDVGAPRAGNTRTYWAGATRDGRVRSAAPAVGDLAFFDKTYDANGNGRVDDELTHVAIVTAIDNDGTVKMVHRGSGRITRLVLNTAHASKPKLNGKKVNSYLRAPGYGSKTGPRLAGQLLRGFARPPLPTGSAPAVATTTAAGEKDQAAKRPAPSTKKIKSKRSRTASKPGRAKGSKVKKTNKHATKRKAKTSKKGKAKTKAAKRSKKSKAKTKAAKRSKKGKAKTKKAKTKKAKRSSNAKKAASRADQRRVDHRSSQV